MTRIRNDNHGIKKKDENIAYQTSHLTTVDRRDHRVIYIEGSQSLDLEATGGHLRVTDGETEGNLTPHSYVCYY